MQLEEIAGAHIVAHQRGDLGGRYLWLGEEGIGEKLHRHPLEDAPQHAARCSAMRAVALRHAGVALASRPARSRRTRRFLAAAARHAR